VHPLFRERTTMITKIGVAAAIALAVVVAAPSASFAASKHKNSSSTSNSFNAKDECTGGSCTATNPDRVPNQSAQFYKKQKTKKPTSTSSNN
jgi:hypothetical protein